MKFRFLGLVILASMVLVSTAEAKPLVLSSLKPLTLIAQEITGIHADVDTLLPSTASHHDYPLKVSDYSRLRKADIFLWVGPELESFLQKPAAAMAPAKVIAAYDLAGINWPAEIAGVNAEKHDHAHDPHLWLDPRNGILVAHALAEKLATIDPAKANYYRQNFQVFAAKVQQLDTKLQLSLKPVAKVGFAVYHEGFAHFVGRYGLHQLDYMTLTPEQKPGARHIHQLREKLTKEGDCLFLEPYNDMQSARDLAQELHLKIGALDALGVQGATTYTQLLEEMAVAFSTCLTNGG